MSHLYRCSQGHEWRSAPSGSTAVVCPQCGGAPSPAAPAAGDGVGGEGSSPDVESGVAYDTLDEMPPPPSGPAIPLPSSKATQPIVPGFEILDELGRGGMGVVYKARQLNLNRVVALKMLLSGAHAGPDELARFRSEAEAVARLQHPNIVQIHDIGQHDNHAYFSLEFVDGGSLARKLVAGPLPPRQAAELVETLARAIQRAHQRDIIHRDLKPANILLTVDDGMPKITDFGLAKRLDNESGLTRTGAVMGTPSYMAPEQAEGRTKEIGPASDIYALGAILYETLTGRPPFREATPLKTLHRVLTEAPPPPRQHNPAVPVALERICLHCLEKEPGRRYGSAQELADDLRRFLNAVPEAEETTAITLPDQQIEPEPTSHRRGTLVAGLVALALLAGVFFLAVYGPALAPQKKPGDSDQLANRPLIDLPKDKDKTPDPLAEKDKDKEPEPKDKGKTEPKDKDKDDKGKDKDKDKDKTKEPDPTPAKPDPPSWQTFRITDRDERFERMSFVSRDVGFAASRSAVYQTRDGGARWQRVSESAVSRVHYLVFTDARTGWLGSDRLLGTEDGGEHWQEVALPEAKGMRSVVSLAVSPGGTLLTGGTNQAGDWLLFRKPAGNAGWEKLDPVKTGYWGEGQAYRKWYLGALAYVEPQHPVAVIYRGNPEGGTILRSVQDGDTWKRTLSELDDTDLYRVCFAGAGRGWLIGSNGSWWKTTNGGRTWDPIDNAAQVTLSGIAVANSGDLGIIPLAKGKMYLTTDGTSWKVVDVELAEQTVAVTVVDAGCAFALASDGRLARYLDPRIPPQKK